MYVKRDANCLQYLTFYQYSCKDPSQNPTSLAIIKNALYFRPSFICLIYLSVNVIACFPYAPKLCACKLCLITLTYGTRLLQVRNYCEEGRDSTSIA